MVRGRVGPQCALPGKKPAVTLLLLMLLLLTTGTLPLKANCHSGTCVAMTWIGAPDSPPTLDTAHLLQRPTARKARKRQAVRARVAHATRPCLSATSHRACFRSAARLTLCVCPAQVLLCGMKLQAAMGKPCTRCWLLAIGYLCCGTTYICTADDAQRVPATKRRKGRMVVAPSAACRAPNGAGWCQSPDGHPCYSASHDRTVPPEAPGQAPKLPALRLRSLLTDPAFRPAAAAAARPGPAGRPACCTTCQAAGLLWAQLVLTRIHGVAEVPGQRLRLPKIRNMRQPLVRRPVGARPGGWRLRLRQGHRLALARRR